MKTHKKYKTTSSSGSMLMAMVKVREKLVKSQGH